MFSVCERCSREMPLAFSPIIEIQDVAGPGTEKLFYKGSAVKVLGISD